MSRSILDDLLEQARDRHSAPAILFLADGERATRSLSYGELVASICSLAGRLQTKNLFAQPVVVALPAGSDYVVAVLACMFAGAIAVPMPEATTGRGSERWAAIVADLQPAAVIAERPFDSSLEIIAVSDVLGDSCWRQPRLDKSAIALIQYTSGSTTSPKGVVVTQGALSANRDMIRDSFGYDSS